MRHKNITTRGFLDAISTSFAPKRTLTPSTFINTPKLAWEFVFNVLPATQRYVDSSLDQRIMDDQYCLYVRTLGGVLRYILRHSLSFPSCFI
ncbi:hypothetical protein Hanom_Chr02g00174581 [Helianthus anomalus]